MGLLLDRIVESSANLSDREFRMLVCMASRTVNNPPEYQAGRDVLAEALGMTVGTDSTNECLRRVVKSLIEKGAITRIQPGGHWGYASYRINDPLRGYAKVRTPDRCFDGKCECHQP